MAETLLTLETLSDKAAQVLSRLQSHRQRLVTAESCTGGLIAALLTAHAGSSEMIEGGLVTYSNVLKQAVLDVATKTLAEHGAVSEPVAVEMAMGALACAEDATISVAVTGIAGPGGGSETKPVGTVCLCLMHGTKNPVHETAFFPGDREAVRLATVNRAFDLILNAL
ncbi:CinA family protein [Asaia astilbis]|uniref:CinA family protein n=1 Tax=Asaia astilbis TaxID=610244 RepID=UPI000471AE7A|nr:CinA family protein [Asaia astilbis]